VGKPRLTKAQRTVVARERERAALQMRKAGATYEQIAQALHIAPMTAYYAVGRALRRITEGYREDAEDIKALELDRLDAMQLILWAQMQAVTSTPEQVLRAVEGLLRVMDRRARYLGIDKSLPAQPRDDIDQPNKAFEPIIKGATTEELYQLRMIVQTIRDRLAERKPLADGPTPPGW
jgi:DNA-binding CsgD family transcriptional regulator